MSGAEESMQVSTSLQTASLQVNASVIRAYAELTDDFNPIHVDAAFAAQTPLGRPIAHGTLSLCLMWQCLALNFTPQELAALDMDVRFVKPVYLGDLVTAGGAPEAQLPGAWKLWVRGQDGTDRIVATVRLPLADAW